MPLPWRSRGSAAPTPDPRTVRPSVPEGLAAIVHRALALEPANRWSSAASFADALDAWLATGQAPAAAGAGAAGAAGVAGAAVVGAAALGAAGDPTTVAGVAQSNPAPIPYAPDAYAGGTVPPGTGTIDEVGDEDEGTSPWVWVAGVAAIILLAVVGFLVFQILSPGERRRRNRGLCRTSPGCPWRKQARKPTGSASISSRRPRSRRRPSARSSRRTRRRAQRWTSAARSRSRWPADLGRSPSRTSASSRSATRSR